MNSEAPRVGWIGAGRMGIPMVSRLVAAGIDVVAWNRTASRLDPLKEAGATVAGRLSELASARVVFSMLENDAALDAVSSLESGPYVNGRGPAIWVECSTVSLESSSRAEERAKHSGTAFLCAPVSGNPLVVEQGGLVFAVSGPIWAYEEARPLLEAIGRNSHYLGGGSEARIVKLCTNSVLGVLTEALAEVLVLAERSGISRSSFMDFVNDSAIASPFTRYKREALVDLDFTATFTSEGLRKDLRLALGAGRDLEVPMPVTSETEVAFSRLVSSGRGSDKDFASVLLQVAADAGLSLSGLHQ